MLRWGVRIRIRGGYTIETDPLRKESYPGPMKRILWKIKNKILKFSNGSCEKSNNSWNFQMDPATSNASMTRWSPPKNYYLMKKLKNPKHLMASVNPIPSQALIYPYVKICSWTLIYQYQGLVSTFLFDIYLWSRFVVKGLIYLYVLCCCSLHLHCFVFLP